MNSSKLFWPYLARNALLHGRGRGELKGSVHIGYVLKFPPFFFFAYVANKAARGGDDLRNSDAGSGDGRRTGAYFRPLGRPDDVLAKNRHVGHKQRGGG